MAVINLTNEDVKFLGNEHPTLIYDSTKNVIHGILSFNLKFNVNGETIKDEYQIEIDLNKVSDLGLPIIRETENKILNIALSKGLPAKDMHLNNVNGEICIIIPPEVKEKYPNGFDLYVLIEHLQEFFYWISYYEKFDKHPWPEYGHGELGYLQLYLKNKNRFRDDVKAYFKSKNRASFRKKILELRKKYKV